VDHFVKFQGQGGSSKVDLELHDESGEQGMGDLLGEEADSSLHLKGKTCLTCLTCLEGLACLTCLKGLACLTCFTCLIWLTCLTCTCVYKVYKDV
jgi:hypothetical protein